MTLDEMLALTREEERRVARLAVPAKMNADEHAEVWQEFARTIIPSILAAYADRDIAYKRMVAITRAVSPGCSASDRAILIAYVATRGLSMKPTHHRNAKPPHYAMALRNVAVDWVENYRKQEPHPLLEDCVTTTLRMLNDIPLFPRAPKASTRL